MKIKTGKLLQLNIDISYKHNVKQKHKLYLYRILKHKARLYIVCVCI